MEEKKLLLFGYPVAHSKSPSMHNAALKAVGLTGWSYDACAVLPEELSRAVEQLRQPEYAGANVTIPHKERIILLMDRLTPAARTIGAVNTVFKNGKVLVGDNTDAAGFIVDLNLKLAKFGQANNLPNKALVLGAGGSARAVVYALYQAGWQIIIAARHIEQARALASAYPAETVRAILLEPAALRTGSMNSHHWTGIDLLVNATPSGMDPNIDGCAWPSDLPLPPNAFIYDLVYKPHQTVLLARAESAGLPNANGLGMLVEQAAISFERWTGVPGPRDIMFKAVQV